MRTLTRGIAIACAFVAAGCAPTFEDGNPPPVPVLVFERPRGAPVGKRVYRRPGRLGPKGGLLGYQERFTYPEVPLVYHPEVKRFVASYTTGRQRSFVAEALERRARYLPIMTEVFRRYGLPEELVNIAFVESRFLPNARCADGSTVGLWQLSKPTAKNYGLRISGKIDERTDVRRSTEAAARFLASLYDTFGDWYLAAAAYNAGPMRVQRAVDRAGMNNLDTLDVFELTTMGILSEITREFVAKFAALRIITRDLERYGFEESEGPKR